MRRPWKVKKQRPVFNPLTPDYALYLKSPQWLTMRDRIIGERKVCESCGGTKPYLSLHHKTYVRLYDELDSDLILLCADCHDGIHGRWGRVAKRAADKAIKEKALAVSLLRCRSGPKETQADTWKRQRQRAKAAT